MDNIESQIEKLRDEEEPYVGMSVSGMNRYMDRRRRDMDRRRPDTGRHRPDMEHCDDEHIRQDPLAGVPLAMTYTPWQQWCETYEPAVAHHRGTIFPELDLPFLAGGDC